MAAAALSVPKRLTFMPPGAPHFKDVVDNTTPGSEQTLLSETVPVGVTRNLLQVVVVCRMEGSFLITANGQAIGSGRTSGSTPNVVFGFNPWRPIPEGQEIAITFCQSFCSVPVKVEAYLQATDLPV